MLTIFQMPMLSLIGHMPFFVHPQLLNRLGPCKQVALIVHGTLPGNTKQVLLRREFVMLFCRATSVFPDIVCAMGFEIVISIQLGDM
jgi:hypothetical protein